MAEEPGSPAMGKGHQKRKASRAVTDKDNVENPSILKKLQTTIGKALSRIRSRSPQPSTLVAPSPTLSRPPSPAPSVEEIPNPEAGGAPNNKPTQRSHNVIKSLDDDHEQDLEDERRGCLTGREKKDGRGRGKGGNKGREDKDLEVIEISDKELGDPAEQLGVYC